MTNDHLINIRQLAQHICLSVSTVNRMLVTGEIIQPDFLVGLHHKRLWKLTSINEWLQKNCVNPKKEVGCK